MRIKDILKGIKFRTSDDIARVGIRTVTDDSRRVSRGSLFIARRGSDQDGGRFISDAIAKGARSVVADKDFDHPETVAGIIVKDPSAATPVIADNFFGHPSRRLKVVGITGTNGKTTISYLIESIIKASGSGAGVIGTINYRIGKKAARATNTTPGPIELQSMMAEMVGSGIKYAVMEVSSHALDQGRVERVLFDAAILTNVTGDHLDYHKTMSGYLAAKRRIFDHMKMGGVAIINCDDRRAASLIRSTRKRIKTIVYGMEATADIYASDIRLSMGGTSLVVHLPNGKFNVSSKLIGMYNVSNILASVAAATALRIPMAAVIKGIDRACRVPGRLESVDAGQPFRVLVDFAHTEDALNNVLSALRKLATGRIITVFGCGGNRDRTKRPLMGRAACRLSDHVIITSDNPRFEDPSSITREIEAGIKGAFSNYDIVVDRYQAIARAMEQASPDDMVLLAGKGHEDCQIIGDRAMPFDDRRVASEVLKRRRRTVVQFETEKCEEGAKCA